MLNIKNNVTIKLILLIVLFSLIFASIIAFFHARAGYNRLIESKYRLFESVEGSYTESIRQNAYDLDLKKLELIANGIVHSGEIGYIRISEFDGKRAAPHILIESGTPANLRDTFRVSYAPLTDEDNYAQVELHAPVPELRKYMSSSILHYLFDLALLFVPLALFFYLIMHAFVVRHILRSAEFTDNFSIDDPGRPLRFDRRSFFPSKNDAIGKLEEGINHMRTNIINFTTERLVFEEKIKNQNKELLAAIKKAEKSEKELIRQNEEYQRLNEEYKAANRELEKARKKAEESNRLKSAFLQNMSHEIRTPMNAIMGFSEFLNEPGLSEEERKKFTSVIQSSSKQLLSIVNDILTISAIETRQEKANIEAVQINDVTSELLSIFSEKANKKNLSLELENGLPDIEAEVMTDRTKLTQILTNLLDNALKFTHEGGIRFGYKLKKDELRFFVKDTGIGVEAEYHDKIFERFRQARHNTGKMYGGTGLGLSISKGFAEILGGKMWMKARKEQGSAFFFTIPYRPVHQPDSDVVGDGDVNRAPAKKYREGATVLVVEDVDFNYLYMKVILGQMNLNVLQARTGREAIDMCHENREIGLVLMDIKMPGMDGITATKQIKEIRPGLPIVAQSAYANEPEIVDYGEIFDGYITKPIKKEVLVNTIERYLPVE